MLKCALSTPACEDRAHKKPEMGDLLGRLRRESRKILRGGNGVKAQHQHLKRKRECGLKNLAPRSPSLTAWFFCRMSMTCLKLVLYKSPGIRYKKGGNLGRRGLTEGVQQFGCGRDVAALPR